MRSTPNELEELALTDTYQCPVCAGRDVRTKFADADLPVRECSCGMVFLMPIPAEPDLHEMYGEEYYASWGISGDGESLPAAMKKETFKSRMRSLPASITTGKVLDVGCATGFFLEVAADAGWEVYGVELSEFSSAVAKKKFGERIFNGTLEQAGYSDGQFDLVTLSDLLEHVPQPDLFLAEVRRILKPGGHVMVITPNVNSLSAHLMGKLWSHYKAEHLLYFTPRTLRGLMERHGFDTLYVGGAAKYLNLAYVVYQFSTYRHPVLTPITRILHALVPGSLQRANFPIYCGEMIGLFKVPSL